MKIRTLGIALLAVLAVAAQAGAQPEGFGVGVIVGEPTGLSVKKWVGNDRAVDAAAAWSFSENDSFQFHADYLFHNFAILRPGDIGGRLPLYVGVGGRLKLEDDDDRDGRNNDDALLGVRVPFGISYLPAKAPIDVFAEIVPVLDVAPDTDFDINGAIGARFYFR